LLGISPTPPLALKGISKGKHSSSCLCIPLHYMMFKNTVDTVQNYTHVLRTGIT